MGMFDSVIATCPNCGETIEWQTKSGYCHLDVFNIDKENVPIVIANSLNGELEQCSNCKEIYKLQSLFPVNNVPMRIT